MTKPCPCPTCGTCPTCGKKPAQPYFYPYYVAPYQVYPTYPYTHYPYTTWGGTSGYIQTTNVTS